MADWIALRQLLVESDEMTKTLGDFQTKYPLKIVKTLVISKQKIPDTEARPFLIEIVKYCPKIIEILNIIKELEINEKSDGQKAPVENAKSRDNSAKRHQLQEEVGQLNNDLESCKKECSTLRQENNKLRRDLDKDKMLILENDQLKSDADKNKRLLAKLQEEIAQWNDKNKAIPQGQETNVSSDLTDTETITRLNKEIQELKADIGDKRTQFKTLESKHEQMKKENRQLQERNTTLAGNEEEVKRLEEKLDDSKRQLQLEKERNKTLEGNNEEVNRLEEKLGDIKRQLQARDDKIEELQTQLNTQTSSDKEAGENKESDIKLEKLQKELKDETKKVDELSKANTRLTESIKVLKDELDKQSKAHADELAKLKKNCENLKTELAKLTKNEKETLKREYESQKSELAQLKKNHETLKSELEKTAERIEGLKNENKDLSNRLAMEMNRKVAGNETALENVGIVCRPMNVASDYQMICSNDWLDAKSYLTDERSVADEQASVWLKEIMMVAFETTPKLYNAILHVQAYMLKKPVEVYDDLVSGHQKEKHYTKVAQDKEPIKLPDTLQNEIGDCYRQTAEKADLKHLEKLIDDALRRDQKTIGVVQYLNDSKIKTYVSSVGRLTWKMTIQRPPMIFSTSGEGKKFEENLQELQWGSDPSKTSARVQYYVHPILYHGGKVMVKGKVFVK